jgi:hypothetical protein
MLARHAALGCPMRQTRSAPPGPDCCAARAVAARTLSHASRMAGGRAGVSGPAWPARYEIRVEDVLDERWADWFGGLQVKSEGTQTVIVGLLADQPALHGALAKVRDLGLCLISVRRLEPGETGNKAPP